MKNRIVSILGILVAVVFLFSSCEKTPIEKSQEDYNYNAIVPVVYKGITGATTAIKTNTKLYTLSYYRGGSTWTWTATGAEVVPIEGSLGNRTNIFFNQSSADLGGKVVISVVETTQGGVQSEPATIEVEVSPFVIIVSGPTEGVASGNWTMDYTTPHDAGATYAWSIVGHAGTVTPNATGGAAVTWNLSATAVTGKVRCIKTFQGLQSVADTAETSLIGYVAKTRDDFIGTFTGTEQDATAVSTTAIAGGAANQIVLPVVAGLPALFKGIFAGWGETFQPGFGNDGNIVVDLDMTSGKVTIVNNYWGQTLPGPYDYWIKGSGGYWNGSNMTIKLKYDMLFSATGSPYRAWTVVLTKQ